MHIILTLILASILVLHKPVIAQEWIVYTNTNNIYDFFFNDSNSSSTLWGATTGGIIRFSLSDSSEKQYTYTTIGSSYYNLVGVKTSAIDGNNVKCFGTKDGYIVKLDANFQWDVINKFNGIPENCEITDIVFDNKNRVWVGTTKGIAKSNSIYEDFTILDSSSGLIDNNVQSIAVQGDTIIWVGTLNGLSKYNILRRRWTNFTISNSGLISNNIKCLLVDSKNRLWCGTNNGVSVLNGNTFTSFSTAQPVQSVAMIQDTLWIGTPAGILKLNGTIWNNVNLQGLLSNDIHYFLVNEDIWVATANGIGRWNGKSWDSYKFKGPLTNQITTIAIDKNGKVWCGEEYKRAAVAGVSMFDGIKWNYYTSANVPGFYYGDAMYRIVVDDLNYKWFCTWGSGLVRLNDNSTKNEWTTYTYNNSGLEGAMNCCDCPRYVVATDIEKDKNGNYWIGNYCQGVKLFNPSDNKWSSFFYDPSGSNHILINNYVRTIEIDKLNRKWFAGTTLSDFTPAVSFLNDNNTPEYLNDDIWQMFTIRDHFVGSDVYDIESEENGSVWIATDGGASKYDGNKWYPYTTADGLPNNNISAIAIDRLNNKWFATANGVAKLSSDNKITIYNTENSGLSSNNVKSIAIDDATNNIWFGTYGGGVCRLKLQKTTIDELSTISVFPNPFIPSSGKLYFCQIQNDRCEIISTDAQITFSIFTLSGELVKKIESDQPKEWNGKNLHNKDVASGIYLFIAITNDGKTKAGKIALVR